MSHILQNIYKFFNRSSLKQTKHIKITHTDYSASYHPDHLITDDFYANLIRTIHWTENIIRRMDGRSPINYSMILRQTNPIYEGEPFYRYHPTEFGYAATPGITFNYLTVLNDALLTRETRSATIKDINELGQILEFYIDITTHDGAPCAESEGFVDESDIPPIDTWFYLTKTKLYCWIPKLFIPQMQAAIDVEILDSYHWIKESNPSLQAKVSRKIKTGS